jgi:hypothetical protein
VFEGPDGTETLANLFAGRSQLIVYHFMFGPDWEAGSSCSLFADSFNGIVVHLNQRDVAFVAVSRAPFAGLDAYRKRMGWGFKWVSCAGNDFNRDYDVSFSDEEVAAGEGYYNYTRQRLYGTEMPGMSVFDKDPADRIFHAYSTDGRGLDAFINQLPVPRRGAEGTRRGHSNTAPDGLGATARRVWPRSRRSAARSTGTICFTPPGPNCCAPWAGPRRPGRPMCGRSRSRRIPRSGHCSRSGPACTGRRRQECMPPDGYTAGTMQRLRARVGSSLLVLPYALIAVGAVLRVVPHPDNFAPIGAIALFGGALLPGAAGLAVPLAALFVSDFALGFYNGWEWVYGSFVLIALLGRTLAGRRSPVRIVGAAILSSVLFFVLTNLGEWFGPLYPHTLAGLREDFIAAVPFFRNTALSDLAYTFAFFGLYDGAARWARSAAAAVRRAGQATAGAAAPPARPAQRTT